MEAQLYWPSRYDAPSPAPSPVELQGRGGFQAPQGPQPTRAVPAPHFEYAGPTSAGRIAAAAAVAGKPGVYYAGAASGGVWKSSDGGTTWKPTFDKETSQAIGALAVSQSNPDVVWAGTGEGWAVRDMDMMGDGIYKSTDAGETWTNMGLKETGRIGTIVVHPTNENIVLVCALGRATGPQHERGVFRTEDGGKTWQQALFVDENTGCSGLQISQKDPNVVIAGTWQMYLQTHVLESGGPGSGIHISRDGGKTFTRIADPGLPKPPYGKTDVAIAPSDGNRMYTLIQTGADGVQPWGATARLKSEAQGSLWRSDDGGKTWKNMSWDRRLIGRAGYYIRIRVSPDNPDHLLIANSTLWRSRDGGKLWVNGGGGCGDCHDIWWDPNANMAGHYIVTGDGGMGIYGSPANPTGNTSVSLPIGQMYRVTVDQRYPYWLYSDRQDDGSMRFSSARPIVPANVPSYAPPAAPVDEAAAGRGGRGGRGGGGGGRGRGAAAEGPAQENMPSCESGYTYPEPNNSRFVWGTCYAAHVATYDEISGLRRSVSPWMHTLDSDPVGLKYRCQWSPPLAIDWFDNSVYFGCQVLFRTRDRGQTWQVISPDLSTGDPGRIRFSGGVVGDNLGQFYGALISAIAPSRTQKGVVWVGTNDGKVWISRDAGTKWTDLTANVKMPKWGLVRRIDASHFDPGTAYIAVDYHLVDNRDPFLAKTTDFGQTWTRLDATLPKGHPLDYTLSIAENPHRKGMVFAGTGHGFFYSRDEGKTWTQYQDKLPAAPVNWIEIPKNAAEVAVATYGRGVWILRDVWQLENGDLETDRRAALQARPGDPDGRGGPGEVRVRAEIGAGLADQDGDPRLGGRGDQHHAVHRPRRTERGVVEPALPAARSRRAAFDPSRQSAHLGRGPLPGTRASARSLGPRRDELAAARDPRQVHRAVHDQRQGLHAALRDLARSDDAGLGRRPGRQLRPAAADHHRDERAGRPHQPHRDHADAGRGPAQGARQRPHARQGAGGALQEDV